MKAIENERHETLSHEVHVLRELNACFQDVSATHDDLSSLKASIESRLSSELYSLSSIAEASKALQAQLEELKHE
jgi:Lon protease-like protein